jgi:tetratricopeptide (TPR) repeat protein
MNENSTHTEQLIQYIDGELAGDQFEFVKKNIEESKAWREEYENLQLAREAMKSYGLKSRIHVIHEEMMSELKTTAASDTGIIRRMLPATLRIAVILVALLGLSAIYQYMVATPEKLFEENFKVFQLRETRSVSINSLEEVYKSGNSELVIKAFTQLKSAQAEDYFLAGNAYLILGEPSNAIAAFLAVEQFNRTHNTHSFEEDAEYYLGLSYLANNESTKALAIFEKIQADPSNAYHSKVSSWFMGKLKHTI